MLIFSFPLDLCRTEEQIPIGSKADEQESIDQKAKHVAAFPFPYRPPTICSDPQASVVE